MVRKCLMDFLIKTIFFLFIFFTFINAEDSVKQKLVHLSYSSTPSEVLKNQVFGISVNALLALEEHFETKTTFENGKNIQLLNKESVWGIKDTNRLSNTFYFKATQESAKLPDIKISLKLKNGTVEEDTLSGETLKVSSINEKIPNFSKLLANKVDIKKYKINKYDDEYNIIVIELETFYGNLEDFKLDNQIKQGIESINYTMPYSRAFYYAIIPNGLQSFEFVYYNLIEKKFFTTSLPIVVDEDKVSTQSELNPKSNDLTFYKIALSVSLALFFIALYVIKRKFIYIVIILSSIGYLTYILIPEENIIVKKDANIYLLPTKNSTIFFISDKQIKVKKLTTREEYIKILLSDDKIGWVRKSDVKN